MSGSFHPFPLHWGRSLGFFLGMLLLGVAGWTHAAISELFVPEAGGVGAVEWQVGAGDATDGGVTLLAVRVSGRASGLVVGSWHTAVSGPVVLWHGGDATALPGFLVDGAVGTLSPIELPAFVDWDDVGWAVVAGDATPFTSQLGATLTARELREELGKTGLLAGVSVGAAGSSAWTPTADELAELGASEEDWVEVAVDGWGAYRPVSLASPAGWLGGQATALGVVRGADYWFEATPGWVNGPVPFFHYPEPTSLMMVLAGGLAGLQRGRLSRGWRC